MVILNKQKFAESDEEYINAESTTETCNGYAKRLKRQIKLFNRQKELVGVITKFGVLACASKLANGKYWYSYATIKEVGEYEKYSEMKEEIDTLALSKTTPGKFLEYVYQFK
jgi:hypothetical protein